MLDKLFLKAGDFFKYLLVQQSYSSKEKSSFPYFAYHSMPISCGCSWLGLDLQVTRQLPTECKGDRTLEKAVQKDCGVSFSGNIQNRSAHDLAKPALGKPALAGSWTRWSPKLLSSPNHSVTLIPWFHGFVIVWIDGTLFYFNLENRHIGRSLVSMLHSRVLLVIN